jgi:uncharacterized protein (DUF488 family)
MTAFDLFSIGHSNIPAPRFTAMVRAAGVDAVADVRSVPMSRFCPWFSQKNLAPLLAAENVAYLFFGEALGGRPRDPALYCDGIADYEEMAKTPSFKAGIDRVLAEAARHRLCLMCSEREPLDCHRCLLVARALAARGATIGHILHDGAIAPHTAIERRLIELVEPEGGDLFVSGLNERLAAAYRSRARAVAYRADDRGKRDSGNTATDRSGKRAMKTATVPTNKSR